MNDPAPRFAGSVPANYRRYLVPLVFNEYARSLVGRVRVPHGGRVLETASGTGVVTRVLHDALPPDATLTATDLNPGMLAEAEEALAGRPDVSFQAADAMDLPFDDDSFDAVLCQFGVMFFPDKLRGFAEAARVLKPGGTFAFSVWDALETNPLPALVFETVGTLFAGDPPAFMRMPFAYHDIQAIRQTLAEAGFRHVSFHVERRRCYAPGARDAALGFISGSPLAAELDDRGGTDAAMAAVIEALRARFGDGPIRVPMQAVEIVARPD